MKAINLFFLVHVDQFLLKVCTNFFGKVTKSKEFKVEEDHIFVNEHSIKFGYQYYGFQVLCHWLCE